MVSAGLILFAKTQLSELSGFKSSDIMPGWSAIGGQTQSPYTRGDVDLQDKGLGHSSPCGSSTGSAVGVSAGYCPLAVGTDSCGSLITPSTRAALYTIRPTIGLVSQKGIVPVSKYFDTAGPMTKTVVDLANLLDVLTESSEGSIPYVKALPGKWSDLRVGVLDPDEWFFDGDLQRPVAAASLQIAEETRKAYKTIKKLVKKYCEIKLISHNKLVLDDEQCMYAIWNADFKEHINEYLADLEWSKVRNLNELIRFNNENAAEELPSNYPTQDMLIKAAETNMPRDHHAKLLGHARLIGGKEGIDAALKRWDIDVILAPADAPYNLLVSAAGYPSATMPMGYLEYNGRPIGLAAFTGAHKEDVLLKVLSAWESTFPARRPPLL